MLPQDYEEQMAAKYGRPADAASGSGVTDYEAIWCELIYSQMTTAEEFPWLTPAQANVMLKYLEKRRNAEDSAIRSAGRGVIQPVVVVNKTR